MDFASYKSTYSRPDVLRGFDESSSLVSDVFFSDENVELVNQKLVIEVYKKLGVRIPLQSVDRLVIAMRYIHATYAKHLPTDIKGQIRELDEKVVQHILPDVITAVEQIVEYEKVIDGQRDFLETPINVSKRNTMTLNRLPQMPSCEEESSP